MVGEKEGVEYESHHFAYSIPSGRSHWPPPGKLGLDGPRRLAPIMATLYDPPISRHRTRVFKMKFNICCPI